MLHQEISKICSDSLRNYSKEKFNIKIKATHAHELVAAYFGYSSKNAMLADEIFSISNFQKAEIFVLVPETQIDIRRMNLVELSEKLPESYALGEAVFAPLFADKNIYKSIFPPFLNFKEFAKYTIEKSENWKSIFSLMDNFPKEHIYQIDEENDFVKITVTHTFRTSGDEVSGFGETEIILRRVVGKIGFKNPQLNIKKWTGDARKVFKVKNGENNE